VSERHAIFISHATPEDNEFTIWLGAKLTAAGYEVWAHVLRLNGGDDWQRKLEDALRNRACKVLLVANQRAVDKQGVRNEIQIASDVARKIEDKNFIIPLRLGNFDAPFLIAHAQYIDFSRGWAPGLYELFQALENEYKVPHADSAKVDPWCSLQMLHGKRLLERSERLISNWLRIRKLPATVFYYRNDELRHHGVQLSFPRKAFGNGFITCEEQPIDSASRHNLDDALESGWAELGIPFGEMRKIFTDLANQGMELVFKSKGLLAYEMANGHNAWWFGGELPDSRLAFRWKDDKGSRQLRGYSTKRKVHWHFGMSAIYRGGPSRHFRIKSRLIFSDDGLIPLTSKARMHRLRRSFTKGWRNARWRDLLLSMLFWLSEGESVLRVPMSLEDDMFVEVPPIVFTSPVGVQDDVTEELDLDDPDIDFEDEEDLNDEED
jgi:hypothetical protein